MKQKLNHRVTIRLNDSDYAKLYSVLTDEYSVSHYIRDLINNNKVPEIIKCNKTKVKKLPKCDSDKLKIIANTTNNINQLARHANQNINDIDELKKVFENLELLAKYVKSNM